MIAAFLCAVFVCATAPEPPTVSPPSYASVQEGETLAVLTPLVAKWEGKRNHAYQDIVGVWTICYGHTKTTRPGQFKTDAECTEMLADELIEYRNGLHTYFTPATKSLRLTPHRDAAYVSLAYNVGIYGAGKSTATRRLNAGDVAGGCKALAWWNKAGGRVVRGLVNRRSEEVQMCMRGLT